MDRLIQFVLSNAVAAVALAVIAAGASRIVRRAPLTRALWILVLLKLFTPPIWNLPVKAPSVSTPAVAGVAARVEPAEQYTIADQPSEWAEATPDPSGPERLEAAPPAPALEPSTESSENFSWVTTVLVLWLAGAMTVSALILRSTLRLRRIISQSIPAPLEIRRRAGHLARTMGAGRCPQILLARGPLPPMLCATGFRRCIILPASLWARLDEAQQDTVLVHELAHLCHGDPWVRRLELIAAVFYWWHPAVWWSRSQLRESSEQCCDAWVVWTLPRLARSYAEALVETVDFISLSRPALPALASGMGQFTDLKRRLVMINQASAPRSLGRTGYTAVCSLAGLLLPLAPGFAQEAAPVAPVPPTPPAELRPPDPFETAPVPPKPAPAPKASALIAPTPFAYSAEEQEADPKPRPDRGRTQVDRSRVERPGADRGPSEVDRARAQVEKLRSQLREAERHLNEVQRDYSRAQADQARDKARAEAEKQRTKAMADAQKERAKAMAAVERDRARADRERAQADRDRAMAERKRDLDESRVRVDGVAPRPKIETNFQYRAEPPRTEEYQRAGARLRAAAAKGQDDVERRLDQMEKQLDELMGQLRQMKRQSARPAPTPEGELRKR